MIVLNQLKNFIVIFGIFVISLYSCKREKTVIPILELSSSACHGECPIFDLKLYENKVYFNLIENNSRKGIYEYNLSDLDKKSINKLVSKIDYNNLKNEYTSAIQDIQVYNSVLHKNQNRKEVYFYPMNAPDDYYKLIEYVINLKDIHFLSKMDTIITFNTRKGMEIDEIEIPLIPK